MICTTLKKIEACGPCSDGWKKLLRHLGKTEADDQPLPLSTILESNGLDDALWATRSAPEHAREWRLFAVWCARQVQHLMADQRSLDALDVAERYANGQATDEELAASRTAADAADAAAWAAGTAARAAARTADAADAARTAARTAAWAADAAAWAAGTAAWAAGTAARTADAAARTAARGAQAARFLEVVGAEVTE